MKLRGIGWLVVALHMQIVNNDNVLSFPFSFVNVFMIPTEILICNAAILALFCNETNLSDGILFFYFFFNCE